MMTTLEEALFEYSEERVLARRSGDYATADFWDRHAQQVLVYLKGARQ